MWVSLSFVARVCVFVARARVCVCVCVGVGVCVGGCGWVGGCVFQLCVL